MAEIALAGLYITLLCWTWGHLVLRIFHAAMPGARAGLPPFSIVCMAGLSGLSVIAGALSVWMPLGGVVLQLALLGIALVYGAWNKEVRTDFIAAVKRVTCIHPAGLCLLSSCLLLLLLMGSWIIIHPDTTGYHAQTIRWIAEYKAIPGLVHLHVRYGYQGYWFLDCALFSFSFLPTQALTFVNTCVAGWYVLFVVGRVSEGLRENRHTGILRSLLLILLFAYTMLDYGMLRLTAVSASPDFVAGIYCWLVFYLLVNKKQEQDGMLIFFFSILAVLIKLSSVPLLLLAGWILYGLIRRGRKKAVLSLVVLAVLAMAPFFARNIITSGHLVFPSPLLDVLHPDWKLDHQSTVRAQQYITDYARVGAKANGGAQIHLLWKQWLPVWWANRSGTEKFSLLSLLSCLLLACSFFKKMVLQAEPGTCLLFFLSAAGLLFWFVQAPDPRFGYGFIFPVQGVVLYRLAVMYPLAVQTGKRVLVPAMGALTLLVTGYTGYRFIRFFHVQNWVRPAGIAPTATRKIIQGGIVFRVPCHTCGCGSTPLPCAYDDNPFLLRGPSLTDGFKSAQPVTSDQ